MKIKYPINLHKGLTAFVVVGMMLYYQDFSQGAYLYLGLHGSYGFLWLLKSRTYPDRQWEKRVSIPYGIFVFLALSLYWLPPFLLTSQHLVPNEFIIVGAISLNMFGMVLHFGSDAQKYYTLKYQPGLITEGFFARSRNTNYLGELMIYVGFALLSMSWIGFIGIAIFFVGAFIPNMIKKDKSLSRYPEFADYKKRSWLMFPRLF